MMPQKYGGRSSFFDTPSGRALTQLSSAPEGPAVGGGGGGYGNMRPSLRNAISDAAGEEMLRTIERRQPWMADIGPGLDGSPRQMYIDPAVADQEDARQRQFLHAMQDTGFESDMEDFSTRRGAALDEDVADFGMRRDVKRYFDPLNAAMRSDDFSRKFRMATEPAKIAAGGRADVANAQADARVAAAQSGERARMFGSAMDLVPEMARTGVFGRDRRGNPVQPSPEVTQQAIDAMRRVLSGGGAGGGRMGGPGPGAGGPGGPAGPAGMMPGGGGGGITPEMQPYIDAGYSPEEVIQHFRNTGRIR